MRFSRAIARGISSQEPDVEGVRYILEYHGELMTSVEHRVSANWSRTEMMTYEDGETMEPDYREPMTAKYSRVLSTDPAVLKLLTGGYDAFAVRTASRILEEHGDTWTRLRRSGNRNAAWTMVETQTIAYCGHDWHGQ